MVEIVQKIVSISQRIVNGDNNTCKLIHKNITLFKSITMLYGTGNITRNMNVGNRMEYFQSHITLLGIQIMLILTWLLVVPWDPQTCTTILSTIKWDASILMSSY